jgi:hypothetical protein
MKSLQTAMSNKDMNMGPTELHFTNVKNIRFKKFRNEASTALRRNFSVFFQWEANVL